MAFEEIIDLTQVLENEMPVFPGSKPVKFATAATFDKEGYHEIWMDYSTHTGTHIDCGYHLMAGGSDTLTTPVNRFIGPGILVDCRNFSPGGLITKEHVMQFEPTIHKAEFVLIHTGWSRYWGSAEYFTGFPVLDEDAAACLASFNLKGIGSDTISFDPVDSVALPVHHALLSGGLILIENLTHLDRLPKNGFMFSCLPLKIKDGDGSPVRAVGIVTRDEGQFARE